MGNNLTFLKNYRILDTTLILQLRPVLTKPGQSGQKNVAVFINCQSV